MLRLLRMYPEIISGATGIIGVVVGTILTQLFSNRSQKRQWNAENQKTEFRELITALNKSFATILALSRNTPFFHDDRYSLDVTLADTDAARTIADRIFISDEIVKLKVMERWTTSATKFARGKDIVAFGNEVRQLTEDLRQSALRIAY